MTKPCRRLSLVRTFAAAFAFLLALLPFAAAPLLAGTEATVPHSMPMTGMSGGHHGPCISTAAEANLTQSGQMHARHAHNCLALCLATHGALMPELPGFDLAWRKPNELPEVPTNCDLHAVTFGIDPPPPRLA